MAKNDYRSLSDLLEENDHSAIVADLNEYCAAVVEKWSQLKLTFAMNSSTLVNRSGTLFKL